MARSTRYLRRTPVGSRTARPKGLRGRAGARVRLQPGLPGTLGSRGGLTHPAPCFSPKGAGLGAPCPPPATSPALPGWPPSLFLPATAARLALPPASPRAFQLLLPHLLLETFYLHGDQWALLPVKSKGD